MSTALLQRIPTCLRHIHGPSLPVHRRRFMRGIAIGAGASLVLGSLLTFAASSDAASDNDRTNYTFTSVDVDGAVATTDAPSIRKA
jgi:hypothetical protein